MDAKVKSTKMDVKELNLEELQHEHPLILIDLQVMHRDYEEDDDDYDDNELIATQNFECTCDRCGKRIDWYHRYYYKCSMSSCNYSIHKFCEKLPKTLKFQGHPSDHTLILTKTTNDQTCRSCFRCHRDGICYQCSVCNYEIDLLCATFVEQHTIHHPGHPHPLLSLSVEPGLNKCFACGEKHEGCFYQCVTCYNFLINFDCLSLPVKLLLQTKHFSHGHFLTLSYSFLDRLYDFECRICGMEFEDDHFIYKCSKCMYYVHPKCATQRIEPSMSILSLGLGQMEKNFKDADHPNLLRFPLDDGSHILSYQIKADTPAHINHWHRIPLSSEYNLSQDTEMITSSSSSSSSVVSLHDPMKRSKLLCTACSRPITKTPFFKCSGSDECDFVLHDWCSRLPEELTNHVAHPKHPLKLDSEPDIHLCDVCGLIYNGFSYCCERCGFFINVNCAFVPEEITHEAHANHLLERADASSSRLSEIKCRACRVPIDEGKIYFRCSACKFYLDCRCALILPKTIRHKLDKHSLTLSYSPIEDHKSQYFCEVCEEELDPGKWFYHCVECAQSIHTACAPLILQCEQDVNSLYVEGVYKFINIKFGAVRKKKSHDHPMSFAPGTSNDGFCQDCGRRLQSSFIYKCLHCKFARHCLKCKDILNDLKTEGVVDYSDHVSVAVLGSSSVSKPMKKDQRQRNLKFYPSEMMRPVTRHWTVAEDM
ncbi:hypothetical protein E3N88_23640 [Mikania micrantha]|uniref:Phorbol-ester/DAG-type domain-containing protein n=1 Tax=Mikania micrantha TaxID=192012 RepID=A0A5N6NEY6_9ASTR|nr:hypothetical protein E3N88_23640 [Mikania micrantha]